MDKSSGGGGGRNTDGNKDSRDLSFGCGLSGGNNSSTTGTPSTAKSGSKNLQSTSSSLLNSLNRSNNLISSINDEIVLNISTTTGGNFQVNVHLQQTIDSLKKVISKKLKVSKDRICLLHRERELHDGSLKDNGLMEGSKVILIPNVETGLLAQRPENTVMQALESLNDSQVNDFLSGKTPLNLSMRLGDHMMLIQLQLSTVNPSSPSNIGSSKAHSSHHHHRTNSRRSLSSTASHQINNYQKQRKIDTSYKSDHQSLVEDRSGYLATNLEIPSSGSSSSSSSLNSSPQNCSDLNSYLSKQDLDKIQNIVKKLAEQQPSTSTGIYSSGSSDLCNDSNLNYSSETTTTDSIFNSDGLLEQSPIKSLSNLVSSPIKTTSIKNIPINNSFNNNSSNLTDENSFDCTDPIAAKLTSCLCNQYSSSSNNLKSNCETTDCQYSTTNTDVDLQKQTAPKSTSTPICKSSSSHSLHKTSNSSISKSKSKIYNSSSSLLRKNFNSNNKYDSAYNSNSDLNNTSGNSKSFVADEICDTTSTNTAQLIAPDRTLAEASRNLTQTLRKLSKEVFTNKIDTEAETSRKNNNSGAVIESMKNHGKGIYSGTFSGTLNPALQDRYGRPKRDISTVIHILNDLLSATPQYSRGARICFETPTNRVSSKPTSKHHKASNTIRVSCTKCSSKSSTEYCEHNNNLPRSMSQTDSKFRTHKKYEFTSVNYSPRPPSSGLSTSNSADKNSGCTCGYQNSLNSDICIDGQIKTICNTCSVQMENNKTKNKLDQLRLVMQQRKQRREERKLKGSPYGGALVAANNTIPTTTNENTVTTPLSSSSPNDATSHSVEEVETVA